MNGSNATAAVAIALAAEGGAPAEIALMPAGNIIARDGRTFVNDDPAAIVAAFNANNADLPIDLEHASEIKAPKGEAAPAVGWIKKLVARDGGIAAVVEWTEDGARYLTSKAYRYISPAFAHDKASPYRIKRIVSAGLTNQPAFHLPALASHNKEEDDTMDRASIATSLGLASAAADTDIVEAIASLKKRADQPDPQKFVPKTDLDAALTRATAAEQKLTERDKAAHEGKIVSAIDQAVKDGKIAPASKDHYLALCRSEGGLEQFEKLVATLPKLTGASTIDNQTAATAAAADVDPVALAAKATEHQKKMAAAGQDIDFATAVAAVSENKESK